MGLCTAVTDESEFKLREWVAEENDKPWAPIEAEWQASDEFCRSHATRSQSLSVESSFVTFRLTSLRYGRKFSVGSSKSKYLTGPSITSCNLYYQNEIFIKIKKNLYGWIDSLLPRLNRFQLRVIKVIWFTISDARSKLHWLRNIFYSRTLQTQILLQHFHETMTAWTSLLCNLAVNNYLKNIYASTVNEWAQKLAFCSIIFRAMGIWIFITKKVDFMENTFKVEYCYPLWIIGWYGINDTSICD